MIIDRGHPTRYFQDVIESHAALFDYVKFGWGTAVVTKDIARKIDILRANGVDFYFGGTLFEKFLVQDRFEEFRRFVAAHGATYVEVSNGTVDLSDAEKAVYVKQLSQDFQVISEVGSKDMAKSETMAPNRWIEYINADLDAGAMRITLETRESGRGGICRPNGELRYGLIEEILTSGVDVDLLMFEAPTLDLQTYFVQRVGPDVSLGNIAFADVISLETVRLGLRSDTLLTFEGATGEER